MPQTWYSMAPLVLFTIVGSLMLIRPLFKRGASNQPTYAVLAILTALFFASAKLGWVVLGALMVTSIAWYLILMYLQRQSIMGQLRGAMGVRISYRSGMPEEEFQRMIRPVLKAAPESARVLLFRRVHYCAEQGLPITRQTIKQLHRLSKLKQADTLDQVYFPKAKLVLQASHSRVYFSGNLSFVGYRDFSPEMNEIVNRAVNEHRLRPEDQDFLRWLERLYEHHVSSNGLYGGPGRPYPDMRWSLDWFMTERIRMSLYFDGEFNLLVAYSDSSKDAIIWERPGARQPELYEENP